MFGIDRGEIQRDRETYIETAENKNPEQSLIAQLVFNNKYSETRL